jgi:hypothetical protein
MRCVECDVVGVEIYIILMFSLHKVAYICPYMAADYNEYKRQAKYNTHDMI